MGWKRLFQLAAICLVLGGLWWRFFYTDKPSPTGPVEVPLAWLSEEVLLTRERGRLYIRTNSTSRIEIYALDNENAEFSGGACIGSENWWLSTSNVQRNNGASAAKKLVLPVEGWVDGIPTIGDPIEYAWLDKPMLPTCKVDPTREATTTFLRGSESYQENRSIKIDGALVQLEHASQKFEGNLYLDRDPIGLIQLKGDRVHRHPFPKSYAETLEIGRRLKWGKIIWDRSLGQALFIHNTCSPGRDNKSECRRKGLWLTSALEPLSAVEIPGKSLIQIKSGYTCFSCGCGCYSHEQIYVENGVIYAHVWGYPVENDTRGIYRLSQTPSGPAWEKIISGRPRAPLAFNSAGNKVAFFEISRLGDEFMIAEIPK